MQSQWDMIKHLSNQHEQIKFISNMDDLNGTTNKTTSKTMPINRTLYPTSRMYINFQAHMEYYRKWPQTHRFIDSWKVYIKDVSSFQ